MAWHVVVRTGFYCPEIQKVGAEIQKIDKDGMAMRLIFDIHCIFSHCHNRVVPVPCVSAVHCSDTRVMGLRTGKAQFGARYISVCDVGNAVGGKMEVVLKMSIFTFTTN